MMNRTTLSIGLLALTGMALASAPPEIQESEWKAPSRAARKKNPLPSNAEVLAAGELVFAAQCVSCHGTTGVGDGVAAKDLEKHPGDLTASQVQSQSDGALFWKVTNGKTPMTAFGDTLSVEERWQVVRYIRTLTGGPPIEGPKLKAPESLRVPLGAIQIPYERLTKALASQNEKEASAAIPALTQSIGALQKVLLPEQEKGLTAAWKKSLGALSLAAERLSAAKQLEAQRSAFGGLSKALESAWSNFGHAHKTPFFVFECSKASKAGAQRWIQTVREPQNPYLGAKQLACVKLLRGISAIQSHPKK